MTKVENPKKIGKITYWILIISSVFVRLYNTGKPLSAEMHSFRQTETAIIIQRYFDDGWSFFHYQIPVLGSPWEVLFECPIYQTLIYFIMEILGKTNIDRWCKIMGVVFFSISGIGLYKLVKLIRDKRLAKVVSLIYFLLPFNIYWSRAALIDFLSVAFALFYCWGLLAWLENKRAVHFIIAMVAGILGYLLKATTMFGFVYFLTFYIIYYFVKQLEQIRKKEKSILKSMILYLKSNIYYVVILGLLCVMPVIFGYAWTQHADFVKSQNEIAQGLTSESLKTWNYGTIGQKIDINNWQVIFKRLVGLFGGICTSIIMIIMFGIRKRKEDAFLFWSSIVSLFGTIFSLFNLYYVHNYYMIAIVPFIAIIFAILLNEPLSIFETGIGLKRIAATLLLLYIGISEVLSNKEYLCETIKPAENESVGLYVGEITQPEENVIIEGEDWNPTTLYYANRRGNMMLSDLSTEKMKDLIEEQYSTLVAHDEACVQDVANAVDIFVEYPYYYKEAAYVAKFFSRDKFEQLVKNHEFIDCSLIGTSFDISNMETEYLSISYPEISEVQSIMVKQVNDAGIQSENEIILIPGKNEIYYNSKKQMKDAVNIEFDTNLPLQVKK